MFCFGLGFFSALNEPVPCSTGLGFLGSSQGYPKHNCSLCVGFSFSFFFLFFEVTCDLCHNQGERVRNKSRGRWEGQPWSHPHLATSIKASVVSTDGWVAPAPSVPSEQGWQSHFIANVSSLWGDVYRSLLTPKFLLSSLEKKIACLLSYID